MVEQMKTVSSENGTNQMEHEGGGMMVNVVLSTSYLTVQLVSVILTGIIRVVLDGLEFVGTRIKIVIVSTVRTTDASSENGMNQMVHRSGDMMVDVVLKMSYLMAHQVSVILMGINHVVIWSVLECVLTIKEVACVLAVSYTHLTLPASDLV